MQFYSLRQALQAFGYKQRHVYHITSPKSCVNNKDWYIKDPVFHLKHRKEIYFCLDWLTCIKLYSLYVYKYLSTWEAAFLFKCLHWSISSILCDIYKPLSFLLSLTVLHASFTLSAVFHTLSSYVLQCQHRIARYIKRKRWSKSSLRQREFYFVSDQIKLEHAFFMSCTIWTRFFLHCLNKTKLSLYNIKVQCLTCFWDISTLLCSS